MYIFFILQWTFNSTWFSGGEKRLKWERTKPSDVYASPVRMSTAFCWWCSGITSSLEWILVMIRPRFRFPSGCAHMPIRHMYRTIPPSTWKTFILTWWHYGIDAFLKDMIKLQISVRRRSNLKNFMWFTSWWILEVMTEDKMKINVWYIWEFYFFFFTGSLWECCSRTFHSYSMNLSSFNTEW